MKMFIDFFSLWQRRSLEGTESAREERGGLPGGSGRLGGEAGQPSVSAAARAAAVGTSRRGAGLGNTSTVK